MDWKVASLGFSTQTQSILVESLALHAALPADNCRQNYLLARHPWSPAAPDYARGPSDDSLRRHLVRLCRLHNSNSADQDRTPASLWLAGVRS
jgi:hypothetical protein